MPATGRIIASIYQRNGMAMSRAGLGGLKNSFPSGQVRFYPANPNTTANGGVPINSIIVLLGQGLRINDVEYGTDSTVDQLTANGS